MKVKDNRETTMLVQGILIWLMLAAISLIVWFCSAAIFYFAQSETNPTLLRFVGAALAATIIVSALIALVNRFRARCR